MLIKSILARKTIFDVTHEAIVVENPLNLTVVALSGVTKAETMGLYQNVAPKGIILVLDGDVDFIEMVDQDSNVAKLYYTVQVPGLGIEMEFDEDIVPCILHPLKGQNQYLIHTQTEHDMRLLEPCFKGGHFVVSWSGLLTSVLIPVEPNLEKVVRQYYVASTTGELY